MPAAMNLWISPGPNSRSESAIWYFMEVIAHASVGGCCFYRFRAITSKLVMFVVQGEEESRLH